MAICFFGSKNDHIKTPKDVYDDLNKEFDFDFDPCPFKHNLKKWDGLTRDWGASNFVNPPYSEVPKWANKAVEEMQKGKLSVLLIPTRCSTKYWHQYIYPNASQIRFYCGKMKFTKKGDGLPTPICAVVFDPRNKQRETILKGSVGGKYTVLNLT